MKVYSTSTFNTIRHGLFLFFLCYYFSVSGQESCGNVTIQVITKPTSLLFSDDGSYTIILTGGPGTFEVTAENGEYCVQDFINCQLYGGTYCDEVPCKQHYGVTLTAGNTSDTILIDQLYGGDYIINVDHDSMGCHYEQTIQVPTPPCNLTLNITSTNPSAPGINDGTIAVDPVDATGDVLLVLFKVGSFGPSEIIDSAWNTHTFSGLGIGSYYLLTRDAVECNKNETITLEGSFCDLEVHVAEISSPTSQGGSDGFIRIEGSSTNGPVKVAEIMFFSNLIFYNTPHTFDGLYPSSYSFEVKDAAGCKAYLDSIYVPALACNLIANVSAQNAMNGTNGSIHISTNSTSSSILAVVKNESNQTIDSSFFAGNTTINSLPPGVYQVYVAEVEIHTGIGSDYLTVYCESTVEIEIGNTVDCSGFSPTAVAVDVTTYGNNDGIINVSSPGGHGQVSIVLNGDCEGEIFSIVSSGGFRRNSLFSQPATLLNSGSFTNLSPGDYHVCFFDEAGCESVQYVTVGSANCVLNTSISSTQPSTNQSNGSIAVTASIAGSNEDVRIFIVRENYGVYQDGFNSVTAYNLPEGNYFVNCYGENSQYCSKEETVVLNDGLNCDIEINVTGTTDVSAYGAQDGMLGASATSSHGNVSLTLGGQTISNQGSFTNLGPGQYQITATDEAGCTAQSPTYGISSPRCGLDLEISVVLPSLGQSNGKITMDQTGVSDTVFISVAVPSIIGFITIAGGINHLELVNLPSDYYNITAYTNDYFYCSDGASLFLPNSCALQSFATGFDASGPYNNDGYIIAGANGGTGLYTFTGPGIQTEYNKFTGLAPGTYTISVTDIAGCSSTKDVTISSPGCFELGIFKQDVTVNGGSDGLASGYFTNGASTGQVIYQLYKNGALVTTVYDNAYFTGLTAGEYNLIGSDEAGCQSSIEFIITQPGCQFDTTITSNPVSIHGGNNGTLTVTAIGGLGIVQVNIQSQLHAINLGPTPSPATFNNLSAGIYQVIVFDEVGCRDTFLHSIQQPACALTTSTQTHAISANGINDGSISVHPIGGLAPFQYILKKGIQILATRQDNDSTLFSMLSAGTYVISITDAGMCINLDTVTLSEPACSPSSSALNIFACNSYNWLGTEYTMSGNYIHNFETAAGCDSTVTLHLTIGYSSSSQIFITNCTSYSWYGTLYTSSGNYSKILVNSMGCDSTLTLNLTIQSEINYYLDADHDGYSVSVVNACTSPGVDYTTNNLPLGDCNDDNPNIHPGATDSNCNGVDENCNGTTDENFIASNCTSCQNGVLTSTIPALPVASATKQPTCLLVTGTISVSIPTSGVSYSFDNGVSFQNSKTKSGLLPGLYQIRVKANVTGCISDATEVLINELPTSPNAPTASTTKQPTCLVSTGTITVSVPAAGHTYSFDNGLTFQSSKIKDSLAPGVYFIVVKSNTTSCVSSATSVSIDSAPSAGPSLPQASTTKQPTCNLPTGTIAVSSPTSGHTFSFDNGLTYQNSKVKDSLQPGTYMIVVKSNATGCISAATTVVVDPVPASGPDAPVASVTKQPTCIISTGTITISVPGSGHTYSFDNGMTYQNSKVKDSLQPGTYQIVTRSNATGCVSLPTPVIIDPMPTSGPMSPSASATKQPTCILFTGTITVSNPTSGHTYSFDNGLTFQSSKVKDSLQPGTYQIVIKSNSTGCISLPTPVTIDPVPTSGPLPPTASVTKPLTCILSTGTIAVSNPTSGHSYSFDNGLTFQSSKVKDSLVPGSYMIVIKSNSTGCISLPTTVTIDPTPVEGPPSPTASTTKQPTCNTPTGTITVSLPSSGHTYSFDNGLTYQSGKVKSGLVPGNYELRVKSNTTGCISESIQIIVDMLPGNPAAPVASVTKQPTCTAPTGSITVSSPTSGFTYSFDDGVNFQNSKIKNNLAPNIYLLRVKSNSTGCISASKQITIDSILCPGSNLIGISGTPQLPNQKESKLWENPLHDQIDIKVFPNPAINYFLINSEELNALKDMELIMTDPVGRVVKHEKIKQGEPHNVRIDVSGLPEGSYFIHLRSKEQHWPVKSMVIFR